ncbi:ABC transporter substrate-binding protein [Cryobacterium frigoriphilum]|uniref:ABC transporter substrate-binding protein n=1 Tax=Cryobacterium frigoriphilum TaxID=1259150 RepID=A0A4R9A575_9MICO|nr:ABC transporter substrate-binding protein [Cryobacterium frigoriphilum]TFD52272.1 ABC transporter substrate-binding protein [Cryobacterium frigoriphilum]
MMKRSWHVSAAATVALSVLLVGCSSKVESAVEVDPGSVKTDIGVTADTINLGAITDLSNVYGPLAKAIVAGNQIYFDGRNADGGICGRQVAIEVQDHASDPQKALTLFQAMQPNVLALTQLLGSPVIKALQPTLTQTETTAAVASWSGDFLDDDYVLLGGTTYPIDNINAISYLLDEGKIAKGDTIGQIYFDGDFGGNALTGTEFAAEELGLTIESVMISPKDTDLAAQIAQLNSAGVTAIFVAAGPKQLASVAGNASALGLDVPIVTNTPGYNPALLTTPVGAFIESNVLIVSSVLPYGDETETTAKVVAGFDAGVTAGTIAADTVPTEEVNYGYAMATVLGDALDTACVNGDLTRAGLTKAINSLSAISTGVTTDLDFTDRALSPSTESFIISPSSSVLGKAVLVAETGTSKAAAAFSK